MSSLRVLHLAGSSVSEFYYNLSMIYAQKVLQPKGVSSYYAIVHPQGVWQLGSALDDLSPKLSLQEMIRQLPEIDVVIPHLFCFPGMTSFRGFFEDLLGLPIVGSPSHCTALASNKAQTRNVVEAMGVKVAKGQAVRSGDTVTMKPPFIVKPNSEDNSLGLTLVKTEDELAAALNKGFEFDETLLVEDYIPGRELRVGVIERDGELFVPRSMIEYIFPENHPIRTVHDKYDLQADGTPGRQPEKPVAKPQCPAEVTPDLWEKIATAAKKAHIALGCRDYSLFDFRIHEITNEPYLLEAGLFWSFGEISMISRMLLADGENLEDVVFEIWNNASQKTRVAHGSLYLSV
ncbi:UNVERIFIED_CONTAM: D-alanine--D-alanine ligase [Euhalothece sp. KZN 001]